jgi:hypothetical protein
VLRAFISYLNMAALLGEMDVINLRLGPHGPDPEGNLGVELFFPDELSLYFQDCLQQRSGGLTTNQVEDSIGNELLLTLYFEGHCEWLGKSTLLPVETASFYPLKCYHCFEGHEMLISFDAPPRFQPLDFFLDYVDVPLEDTAMPGFGNLRLVGNRIFKDMISSAKFHIRGYLAQNPTQPGEEEIRSIYQRILEF